MAKKGSRLLGGLNFENIITNAAENVVEASSEDDYLEKKAPARLSTRPSRVGGAKQVNYDMKYHPMDEVTRPNSSVTRRHRSKSVSFADIGSDEEEEEEEQTSSSSRECDTQGESSDSPSSSDSPEHQFAPITPTPTSRQQDPHAVRQSSRSAAQKYVNYSRKHHPQDYGLPGYMYKAQGLAVPALEEQGAQSSKRSKKRKIRLLESDSEDDDLEVKRASKAYREVVSFSGKSLKAKSAKRLARHLESDSEDNPPATEQPRKARKNSRSLGSDEVPSSFSKSSQPKPKLAKAPSKQSKTSTKRKPLEHRSIHLERYTPKMAHIDDATRPLEIPDPENDASESASDDEDLPAIFEDPMPETTAAAGDQSKSSVSTPDEEMLRQVFQFTERTQLSIVRPYASCRWTRNSLDTNIRDGETDSNPQDSFATMTGDQMVDWDKMSSPLGEEEKVPSTSKDNEARSQVSKEYEMPPQTNQEDKMPSPTGPQNEMPLRLDELETLVPVTEEDEVPAPHDGDDEGPPLPFEEMENVESDCHSNTDPDQSPHFDEEMGIIMSARESHIGSSTSPSEERRETVRPALPSSQDLLSTFRDYWSKLMGDGKATRTALNVSQFEDNRDNSEPADDAVTDQSQQKRNEEDAVEGSDFEPSPSTSSLKYELAALR